MVVDEGGTRRECGWCAQGMRIWGVWGVWGVWDEVRVNKAASRQ